MIRQVGADYRVLGHRSSSLGTLGTKRACSAIPGLQARPVCNTWHGPVVPGKDMVDRAPPTGRANVGRLHGAAVSSQLAVPIGAGGVFGWDVCPVSASLTLASHEVDQILA